MWSFLTSLPLESRAWFQFVTHKTIAQDTFTPTFVIQSQRNGNNLDAQDTGPAYI